MIVVDAPRRQPAPPWAVHALLAGLFAAGGFHYQAQVQEGLLLSEVMTTPPAMRWQGSA